MQAVKSPPMAVQIRLFAGQSHLPAVVVGQSRRYCLVLVVGRRRSPG